MMIERRMLLVGIVCVACGSALLSTSVAAGRPGEALRIEASRTTGLATFVTARDGGAIPVALPAGRTTVTADDFLRDHGPLFGVTAPAQQLVVADVHTDSLGFTHTTYHQVHNGVPVFSGVLKIHQNANGDVVAANGDFYPITSKLNVTPTLTAEEAADAARTAIDVEQAAVEQSELVIVDPGWYGDPAIGDHLAYHLILTDLSVPMREALFVDAHSGAVLDRWTMLHTARVRAVYDGQGGSGLPGVLARSEGGPPVVSPEDVNRAYDYAGDIYDYLNRAFSRDGIDDAGMTMILTVNSTAPPCPNAFWDSTQMVFCTGTVTDDITAHEMGHGVTERTANLIYQNQSGQLNESYSDVFGELIDLFNGDVAFPGPPSGTPWPAHLTGPGQDTPNNLRTACSPATSYPDGVRWLLGEDATAFGGAIRDMWDPPCEGHPDRANSPLQTCNALDSGGVHSGSGIPNHAFAILTDGKTFNGQTVSAIGPIKSAAVWYRALTTYLTVASDFKDAYLAMNQAAADLVGTFPNDPRTGAPTLDRFSADDAAEVDKALLAVEMNTDGACGATVDILDPTPPTECSSRTAFFADDFEGGINGWTVAMSGTPNNPYDWEQTSQLPFGRAGTGWVCPNINDGCPAGGEESAVHFLFSPMIAVPAVVSQPTLKFTHYVATEPAYDGGNVKISIGGGAWTLIPASAFGHNPYNTSLNGGDNTNPLAGEPAWSGVGGGWGTSLIDLSSFVTGGETIQLSFEFGKDWCNGVDGWYLDDVELYNCTCEFAADCDDGLFCTGTADCVGGACVPGTNPCGGDFCDEGGAACLSAAFWDDFESGNVNGWNLYGAGSTASSGAWLVGNPNGTSTGGAQAQPEDAFEGLGCAFTAQNSSLGTDDVDNGVVYLVSPTIDLSGQVSAELRFVRWFYQRDIGDDASDFYVADISSDDGSSWVNLETLGASQSANEWTQRVFLVEDFVPLTNRIRIRFGASDGTADGDIVESAIDDVLVVLTAPPCEPPTAVAEGGRWIAASAAPGDVEVALLVTGDPGDPAVACLSQYVQADGLLGPNPIYQLPSVWDTVHVRSAAIIPLATYQFQAECLGGANPVLSSSSSTTMWAWGDVDQDGNAGFLDILLQVNVFKEDFSEATIEAADLEPCTPDASVGFLDMLMAVQGFKDKPYTDSGCSEPCP